LATGHQIAFDASTLGALVDSRWTLVDALCRRRPATLLAARNTFDRGIARCEPGNTVNGPISRLMRPDRAMTFGVVKVFPEPVTLTSV
jgi:hypothetical protein